MKKTLKILTALSIAASSLLFATPSQAVTTLNLALNCTNTVNRNDQPVSDGWIVVTTYTNCVEIETLLPYGTTWELKNGSSTITATSGGVQGSGTQGIMQSSPQWVGLNSSSTYVLTTTLPNPLPALYVNNWTGGWARGAGGGLSGVAGWYQHAIGPFTVFYFTIDPSYVPPSATTAPSAPTSVVAAATGKRSATVSFAAPASNGGSAVTSYTATSSPGGLTKTITQAGGGTFTFDNLQPSTAYTFAVTATNAIGTSAAATSNSIKTLALDIASISALSFADDGTGTGGKIIWSGKNIDAVLYTGPAASYPGPYNYGAFTGGWNGRIRNLTPDTSYTVSIFAVSADGVGESKSLTFKTSATLPALAGSASSTVSQAAQMATQLPKLYTWINENVFVDGEGDRMKTVLNKFDAVTVPAHSAYLKLPNSSVVAVSASTSTPAVCKVEGQVTVHSIAAGTCTISYTVSGASKAPATLVKDFVFAKFAK